MTLSEQYLKTIKAEGYQSDSLQLEAINKLQIISEHLTNAGIQTSKWSFFRSQKPTYIKGLYLWGGVGRGKTFIMDLFYNNLNFPAKRRQHFSHFMKEVHQRLQDNKGKKSPLNLVAKEIANSSKIICFDEFFVEDIADAMILGNLFTMLFKLGITLVATSNIPPDRLYLSGLQRALFLPAIDEIKSHCDVFNLDRGIDYRQEMSEDNRRYFFPLATANKEIKALFLSKATEHALYNSDIILEDRVIAIKAVDESIIWFDFISLCGHARGVNDYIALAKRFDELFISNLPILTQKYENETRRFIALIDEFYDQEKLVTIAAETDFNQIYQGERLKFEFQRTISRLQEMQSNEYAKH